MFDYEIKILKQIKKNPNPLVIKGVFFVTATFEDKRYVVSNGLSFLNFAKPGEDIKKGDYLRIHGPVYQRKDAGNPIITGEAVVEKLTEAEIEEYKTAMNKMFDTKPAAKKVPTGEGITDKNELINLYNSISGNSNLSVEQRVKAMHDIQERIKELDAKKAPAKKKTAAKPDEHKMPWE